MTRADPHHLTVRDRRDWRREMDAQDRGWLIGYEHGRQDRLREWTSLVLGYIVGTKGRGHPLAGLMLAGIALCVIAIAVHYWWVIVLGVAGKRLLTVLLERSRTTGRPTSREPLEDPSSPGRRLDSCRSEFAWVPTCRDRSLRIAARNGKTSILSEGWVISVSARPDSHSLDRIRSLIPVTQGARDLTVLPIPSRSPADAFMQRVLRIPATTRSRSVETARAQRIFGVSIGLSALRCLLSYIVLPILTPVFGSALGVQPAVGIPIAVVALAFDARGIRRFWIADHRWRWPITALYLIVMVLVMVLLVHDIVQIA